MARRSDTTVSLGSQFYIVQNTGLTENDKPAAEYYKENANEPITDRAGNTLHWSDIFPGLDDKNTNEVKWGDLYPLPILERYMDDGGTLGLQYEYTVFGQVLEGMDVVDAIAKTPRDGYDKPIDPVVIENIVFEIVG